MSLVLRFFLPAVLATLLAPSIAGAMLRKDVRALLEPPEITNLVILPLIIGGLAVFVLPVARRVAASKSKAIFLAASLAAGFIGGTVTAMLALLIASLGSGIPSPGSLLAVGTYFGGSLGSVSAIIWALFNIQSADQNA